MRLSHNGKRIDTTLGDLIAAVSEVAFEYSADTEDAYHLAGLLLGEILKDAIRGDEIKNLPAVWN